MTYVVDDVCYAGNPGQDVRVVEAKPLRGGMLLLMFSSGEKKLFDTTLLEGPAFFSLRDEAVFQSVCVEHGFVSWADGAIDVSPEYLYEHGVKYDEDDVLLAGEAAFEREFIEYEAVNGRRCRAHVRLL